MRNFVLIISITYKFFTGLSSSIGQNNTLDLRLHKYKYANYVLIDEKLIDHSGIIIPSLR